MKRGKDDEKIMGPMFPRLHVNDTEKGGPRAPPRNKMALYEQLSIPSQRFNPGVLPLNPSNGRCLVHPASSSQARQTEAANLSTPLPQAEQRKKGGDEDDFRVPVFVGAAMGRRHGKNQNGIDRKRHTSSSHTGQSMKLQNLNDTDLSRTSSSSSLRNPIKDQNRESQKVCSSRKRPLKSATDTSTRENMNDIPMKDSDTSPEQDCEEQSLSEFSRVHDDLSSPRTGAQPSHHVCVGGVREMEITALPQSRSESYSVEDRSSPDEPSNDSEGCGYKNLENGNRSDDASETSMVDSVSVLDICPDDIVGIIGQKHFWKARRAIVNQQRVFAVQVFELHRLIKVQRLIAGSPNLLIEDSAYLGKPTSKCSTAKKLPSEYVVKPLPRVKQKDDSEKPSQKMECSAENAVVRTSLSSVKNGSQQSNYGPFLENQPPPPVVADNKMSPFCFHQSPGHQWLVPVMSPTEGLVYKPYPGPGFMGPVCGGCGPFGQTPMTGNFMAPTYGIPATPPHHQGSGILPVPSPVGHMYFPSYGMPAMNPAVSGSAVEQMNQYVGPGSHSPADQSTGVGANLNIQRQSSCNMHTEKNGTISHARKFQASKDTELQGSTASSPSERVQQDRNCSAANRRNTQGDGNRNASGGKDALLLFPTSPMSVKEAPQPHNADQPIRVIRVVPHNPTSATESAARIFQSIQEERKQYDSV